MALQVLGRVEFDILLVPWLSAKAELLRCWKLTDGLQHLKMLCSLGL